MVNTKWFVSIKEVGRVPMGRQYTLSPIIQPATLASSYHIQKKRLIIRLKFLILFGSFKKQKYYYLVANASRGLTWAGKHKHSAEKKRANN